MESTIRKVLDKYADTQLNFASEAARALLAKEINDALALHGNVVLSRDDRQREWDENFGKVPTLAVKLLAGDK